MVSQLILPTTSAQLAGWSLLFAREPEPDPDLDDIPASSADRGRSGLAPAPPPRRSSRGPFLLLLLLLIIAGGTYLYMEPETLRAVLPESVLDLLGEAPPSPGPMSREPSPEGPPPPAAAPMAKEERPPVMAGESPPANAPGIPIPSAPPLPVPSGEPNRAPLVPTPPPVAGAVPEPRFGEGQLVMVKRNPAAPDQPVALTGDANGMRPGPMVKPGTAVRVLDGDLQNNAWVYSVKTPDGAKGWLAEERLQAAP